MTILTGKNAIGIIEGREISINAKYDNLDLLKSAMIDHDIDGNFEMLSAGATLKLKWKLIDNGIYDDIDENINIRQKIAKIKAIRKEYRYTDLPYLYANYNHNCNPKYQTEEFVKNLKENGRIAFSLNETTVYRLDDNSLFSFNCDFIICAKLENNDFGSLDNDAVLFRYKDYLRDLIKSYELYLEVAEEVEKLIQAKAA